jgi:O-antigen/teichoic acid export membrane protein
LLKNIWRFAAGMSGITLTALILTQLDKVILSKLLSLELFGYYTLAGIVGNGLGVLIAPIFNVVFPALCALVAVGDTEAIKRFYHRSAQVMAVIILPMAAVIALFSFDILQLWMGSTVTAQNAAPIVSVLVVGTALNGLMNLPYALQLAYGWTSLGLRINIFLIATMVPAIFFMASRYGPVGAAAVWVVLNSVYMLIGVPLTHHRLLKGEAGRWFVEDTLLPLLGVMLVTGIGRQLPTGPLPSFVTVLSLTLIMLCALAAAAIVAPQVRAWAVSQLSRLWFVYRVPHHPASK